MISVSAKCQIEVMENSLRSVRSQGKVRENENREKVATLYYFILVNTFPYLQYRPIYDVKCRVSIKVVNPVQPVYKYKSCMC